MRFQNNESNIFWRHILVLDRFVMKLKFHFDEIFYIAPNWTFSDPCLLILEYVKYGKLLTHLREQRGRDSLFDGLGDPAGDINLLGDDDRYGH